MTRDIIAPLIEKARERGLTIIFAPSPGVIDAHRAKYRVYQGWDSKQPLAPAPTWPPEEFLGRQGRYEIFRDPRHQPPGIQGFWESKGQGLDMLPLVKIRDGDFVVATGQQMHDLCEERRILYLPYVGFATNWCILGRDYGVGLMRGRGYNTIILRDATEGAEFPDTLEKRWATELAIREVEQRHGFLASNVDFYAACDEVRRKIWAARTATKGGTTDYTYDTVGKRKSHEWHLLKACFGRGSAQLRPPRRIASVKMEGEAVASRSLR